MANEDKTKQDEAEGIRETDALDAVYDAESRIESSEGYSYAPLETLEPLEGYDIYGERIVPESSDSEDEGSEPVEEEPEEEPAEEEPVEEPTEEETEEPESEETESEETGSEEESEDESEEEEPEEDPLAALTQEAVDMAIKTLRKEKTLDSRVVDWRYMTNKEIREKAFELVAAEPRFVDAGVDPDYVADIVVDARPKDISMNALLIYITKELGSDGLPIGLTADREDLIKLAMSLGYTKKDGLEIYKDRESEIRYLSRLKVRKAAKALKVVADGGVKARHAGREILKSFYNELKRADEAEDKVKKLGDKLDALVEDCERKVRRGIIKGFVWGVVASAVVIGILLGSLFKGGLLHACQRVVYVEKDKDPGSSEVKPNDPTNPGEEQGEKVIEITLGAVSAEQSAQIAKKLGVAGSVVFNQAKSIVRGEDGKYYVTLLTTNNELYLAGLYSSAESTTKDVDTMIAQLSGQSEKFIPLTALNLTDVAQTKFTQIMELKADKAGTVYTKEPSVKAGETVRGSMCGALLANDGSVCVAQDVIKVSVIKSAESMSSNKENVLKLVQWELDSTNKANYPGNMKYSVSIDGKNGYSAEAKTYEAVPQWEDELAAKVEEAAAIVAGDYDYTPGVKDESGAKNNFKQNNSRLAGKSITDVQRTYNRSPRDIYSER